MTSFTSKIPIKLLVNVIAIFTVLSFTGCAGDGSISSHFSLADRIKAKRSVDLVFVDFQPSRISVVDGCDSTLSSCIVRGIIESSVLSVTGSKDAVVEQKLRFATKIRTAFERSSFKDQFLSSLTTEAAKCGLRLNYIQSIPVKNEDEGSLSGATSLKWALGGQDSTEHARKSIVPRIPQVSDPHSMIVLIAVSHLTLSLGNENTLFPSLGYMFYDKEIDTITRLLSLAYARKGKEVRVISDIGSETEVSRELKISANWAAKRLAYDMCGGIGSDHPNVKALGKELS